MEFNASGVIIGCAIISLIWAALQFAEATAAALVIGSSISQTGGWDALVFPIIVSAFGIIVCLLCSFIATHISPVKSQGQVEKALKVQLISTTVLMVPAVFLAADGFLQETFQIR